MDTNIEKVISVLHKVKGFEKITKQDCNIKRLGGMTNIVHLVETKDINLVVRIPGKGTEDYINRNFEYNNAMAAWRAGISAEIVWADVDNGIMVSKAINGIETSTIFNDMLWVVLFSVIILPLALIGRKNVLTRKKGIMLLALYLIFIIPLIV